MVNRRPDFVIIGATKSGTSWIVANLQQQHGVSIPMQPVASLHYFSRYFDRGTDWYLDHFRNVGDDVDFLGEKSASYLPHPEVPARLKEFVPQARLIAQLRNPIDRAYSDYCMHLRRGQADANIERYLVPEGSPIPRLLQDGLYFKHLSRYLDLFDPDQILVTIYEEMERDPEKVLRSIAKHVGIGEPVIPDNLGARVKGKETPMLPLAMRKILAPVKGIVAPVRHTAVFQSARSMLARPIRYPPLSEALRARLTDYFRPDTDALARLLNRDLNEWNWPSASIAA